jgi:hypothetical protein
MGSVITSSPWRRSDCARLQSTAPRCLAPCGWNPPKELSTPLAQVGGQPSGPPAPAAKRTLLSMTAGGGNGRRIPSGTRRRRSGASGGCIAPSQDPDPVQAGAGDRQAGAALEDAFRGSWSYHWRPAVPTTLTVAALRGLGRWSGSGGRGCLAPPSGSRRGGSFDLRCFHNLCPAAPSPSQPGGIGREVVRATRVQREPDLPTQASRSTLAQREPGNQHVGIDDRLGAVVADELLSDDDSQRILPVSVSKTRGFYDPWFPY